MTPAVSPATLVFMDLAPFPVNLGAAADPAVIPLGEVPAWTNHGYGVAELITRPLPVPDGAWQGKQGLISNLNLASEYGITLDLGEPASIGDVPVILRVKAWPKPVDSPYRRDQVITATLLCLLRSLGGSDEQPVVIEVAAEDPAEQAVLNRFSGPYIYDTKSEQLALGALPGADWKREEDGVFRVRFPEVKAQAPGQAPAVAFVPVQIGGGDADEAVGLIPTWTMGSPVEALELTWSAVPRQLQALSVKKRENANPVHGAGLKCSSIDGREGQASHVRMTLPMEWDEELPREFAAALWSMALTDAIANGPGLEIDCTAGVKELPDWKEMFAGWARIEPGALDSSIRFKQKIRYDLKKNELIEGKIDGWTLKAKPGGGWILVPTKPPIERKEPELALPEKDAF